MYSGIKVLSKSQMQAMMFCVKSVAAMRCVRRNDRPPVAARAIRK